MTALPTLDPEIADLGLAIGLLTPSTTGGVELDSDWFSSPGPKLAGAMADDGRRHALVRFVDTVLAKGVHDEHDGITYLHLFSLRDLARESGAADPATLPDLSVQVTLDERPPTYVEVGLAASLTTTDPDTSTSLVVPLYRAGKGSNHISQPFALLDGGVVRVSTELALQTTPPAQADFGLAGVQVAIATALTGTPSPEFQLTLKGLHLPGAATSSDLAIGGPGVDIQDALLSLVLGLVRQGADALTGPAAVEVGAALDLFGIGDAIGIPALPVAELVEQGVDRLRDWFVEVMGAAPARTAWLTALAQLLGGAVTGDHVAIQVGGGPVTATIGIRAVTAPSGHLVVTPQLGLSLSTTVGTVQLGAEAVADLVTIDTANGALTPIPDAEVVVTAAGTGATKLLDTATAKVGSVRLGLAVRAGALHPLLELRTVEFGGHPPQDLDLSSPDAVVAAAGQLAATLLGDALDALGAAGTELKALLGLTGTGGMPALQAEHLLTDPLGTLATWWHDLLTTHQADVPAVLAHLCNLLAPAMPPPAVTGTGTAADPWSIPVVPKLTIDAWLDAGRLIVAPTLSLRSTNLAGDCTLVLTTVRMQLASIDLAGRHAQFPLAVDVTAKLRDRGGTEARLALGPVAIVADFVGVQAHWGPAAGFGVDFLAPNLAIDTGATRVPLVLPTVDANGHLDVPPAAWTSVEALLGVLAASAPTGWLADLTDLTGWTLGGQPRGPRLSLAALVASPLPTLEAWLAALATDADLVGSLTATIAHLAGGSSDGLAGVFTGSGTPEDPWLAGLGRTEAAPAIAVWLSPHGPVLAATLAGQALQTWRPGMPGLPPDGLAQALLDEARSGPDVAALAHGRADIGSGLQSLAARWTGTDGMVAAPPAPIASLTTVVRPDLAWRQLPDVDLAEVLPGGVPAGAVVVRVYVTGAPFDSKTLPWNPAGRLLDLTAPGLAAASFSVPTPATGLWDVALAPRADAGLGDATDPSGLVGQSARLQQVLGQLVPAGPVVLVAFGGAGHAARMAADAVVGVTHLVTLGAPWSAATFDTARVGVPADALRLMSALLPAEDTAEPDDNDLHRGRHLVTGFLDAVRGRGAVLDLEAPRPDLAVRTGLTAVAVFGSLSEAAVLRAMTAVFAAGLAGRAQDRLAIASEPPTATHLGVRVPFALGTPPGGHGTTIAGSLTLELGSVSRVGPTITAQPGLTLELSVDDTDGWLIGGPGTTPVGGALPLEVRRVTARVDVGLHGGDSSAQVVLHEGSALGADWVSQLVAPPSAPTGEVELQPLLPEARALLTALTAKLATVVPSSPAGVLLALFKAAGICQPDGALIPDALAHLLHDPGAQLRSVLNVPASRDALLAALTGLLPELTVTGGAAHLALGPLTADADLAARTIGFTATGTEGLLHWHAGAQLDAAGHLSCTAGLGDPASDAFALDVRSGPLRAQLVRGGGAAPVSLWPTLDVDGLGRLAAAAIPAEALRVTLEGLRNIDNQLGTALDDLTSALGMLRPPDANGFRAIAAPVRLFDDPAGWFSQAGVLAVLSGGPFDVTKLVDLLEALKPFIGLAPGTPRGVWPITAGVQVSITPAAAGPSIALAIDATEWLAGLAGHPPVAAGLTAGLTLPAAGAPRPSVELFVGVPDGPGGAATPQHRSAAHLIVDGTGLRLVLRPATGADIEIYPNPAGLGALFGGGVDAVLPTVLTQLAAMTGDATRTEIAALVGAVGRGLAVATGTPAVFDRTALHALADNPGAYLSAHLGPLLTSAGAALDPVLQRLLGLPAASHVAVLSSSGVLTITVGSAVIEVHPSPLALRVQASATGLPVIDSVTVALAVDGTGVSGWSAAVGPAAIDIDGPVIRPVVRVAYAAVAGWQAEVGLGLDDTAPTAIDHRELIARWQQAGGLTVLATHRRDATNVDEDETPAGVATAAVGAVLDLVGGWVLGVPVVKTQLNTPLGTKTVRFVLEGSILEPAVSPADDPQLLPGVLDNWPAKLFTVASQLAAAAPSVDVSPFTFKIAKTGDLLGIAITTTDPAGLALSSGETTLNLEMDASWIDEPGGGSPEPGIVLDLLRVNGVNFSPAPGIAANGVGLRLGKSSGPLIDAGLRLDSVAVHLFGSIVLGTTNQPELAGGFQIELGGLGVPLGGGGGDNAVAQGIMHDAGGSGAPPRPSFSPAVAVQDHGTGVAVTLRAGKGDGPWFMPIQRAFGPVYLEQIGVGVSYQQGLTPKQLDMISLYLDGSVSLLGLSASVEKLRFGYHVGRPFFDGSSWEIDVAGFAISASIAGLTLAGGLVKFPLDAPLIGVEYLGMLKISYSSYGIDLFGGYAHPTTPSGAEFASFFAFGVLHAPLGGVPAFFITGIGIGFGINRELHTPTIDQVNTHPFMQALRSGGPAPEPMQQLKNMRTIVPPAQGEYWVAAGISFTSFVLINGEILLTVQFGDGLEIAILGLARVQLPTADTALVSVELALLARFSSKEGLLLVQAQLTENSWVLDKSVHLTGGFAFAAWWKGPNAGQFVITVGGYHPRFHHDGYPVVPRVGLRWQPADFISIEGGVYFALCSEAIMAGVGLEIAAHLGPAHADLRLGADGIVFFDPFWFEVAVYAEAHVGIRIWLLFGSIDVEVSLGFEVIVDGPPIHVHGHFSVYGVEIPFEFGDSADPAELALDAIQFAAKYLRGDAGAQVVQAAVLRGGLTAGKSSAPNSGGVDKPPDGSAAHPFRVVPEFVVTFVTTAPTETVQLTCAAGSKDTTVSAPGLGVAPMYSATLETTLTVALTSDEAQPFGVNKVQLSARPAAAFPKGVWGPAPNPKAKTVPAGDTVDACDGMALDTVLPDSLFTGAAPIDYHQIELPIDGKRKPLPFVTNKVNTDQRVTEAVALRTAAAVFADGNPDANLRFERAALVMAAAGTGRTTVAALRGERTASPTFGSLADDLIVSPAPVSPPVTPVVVDRTKPAPRRWAPLVKAVLGAPLAVALDRPSGTTVADRGKSVSRIAPTLASVQSAHVGRTQLGLTLVPRAAQQTDRTLAAVGIAPVTRLASGAVGAVANARPAPQAAQRLATMSDRLLDLAADGLTARAGSGATVHDGELAVITVANRPSGDALDTLTIVGGATRVLCLAAGGRTLDDQVVPADPVQGIVELPRATERVILVGVGASAAIAGPVPGWYAGQSLPSIGWGAALAGGTVVLAQGSRVRDNRDRGDGGWLSAHELVTAGRVVTTFTDPVDVVAIVIDDYLGSDAAAQVSMRLLDAARVVDAAGEPVPPQVLVDGVRSILLYPVTTTGPVPGVLVDGCGQGHLGGVLGGAGGIAALAELLAVTGVAAAVAQPLVGGPGRRQVTITLADGPVEKFVPRRVRPRPVKKAAPAKKTAAKKVAAKKAVPAKKAPAKKTPVKRARR